MKTRELSLKIAKSIADQLCTNLTKGCDKIAVAGSIRRRRPFIHDIDIVAVPKYQPGPTETLFGDQVQINLLDVTLNTLVSSGRIRITERGDKAIRLELPSGELPVDVYIARPETWATLLLIRTGSREHNIRMCSLARQLGMQLKADGSGLFRAGTLVAGSSETEIFEALGMTYVTPEYREEQYFRKPTRTLA